MEKKYVAIDLKSFYASVECVERGLNPMTTNLVVADESRTDKTICLAVSPSLKAFGIPGRPRLFEVKQRLREVNRLRPGNPVEFITAMPRMALYIEYSTRVYTTYLDYVSAEDIHVYSIDEVFIDVTEYLKLYKTTAHDLARRMVNDVLSRTGITATAGIGTNLYLAKVAMDIVAKHLPADKDGVRIAELDEMSYRRQLWNHMPLTDFWRVGRGLARKLEAHGMYTMGQVARCSVRREGLLYTLFGVNAELLIDHAWGWEPCTIQAIKNYRPGSSSFSHGQVLSEAFNFAKARVTVSEMADAAALDLVDKHMVCDQLVLTVGYDTESLAVADYRGPIVTDWYGRSVPQHAQGTANLGGFTSSGAYILKAVTELYDHIVDRRLLVRRLNLSMNHVVDEQSVAQKVVQLDLFDDHEARERRLEQERAELKRERTLQETVLKIKKRFGKNAVLKGLNFGEGATAQERNRQIGGHRA